MRWSEEVARIRGKEAGYKQGHHDGYKIGFRDAVHSGAATVRAVIPRH